MQNKSTEHQEQVALVTWFRIRFPLLRMALFAIPNGGLRHIKVAMTLKAEGVIAGVSDLFLMVPRGTLAPCGLPVDNSRIPVDKRPRGVWITFVYLCSTLWYTKKGEIRIHV